MPKYLGVDYGEKRVGLAISDPDGIIAMPLDTVELPSPSAAAEWVARRIQTIQPPPVCIIVGMPLNMNGTASAMSEQVHQFMDRLRTKLNIPIKSWDERLSTHFVERMLVDSDVRRDKRKQVRDKLAAQVVLQNYLDAHPSNPMPLFGNEPPQGELDGR